MLLNWLGFHVLLLDLISVSSLFICIVIWSFTYSFCLDITLVPALSVPALSMPVCGACLFDCVALVLDLSLVPGLGS